MGVLLLLLLLAAVLSWMGQRNDHCRAHVAGIGCHHVCDLPPGRHRHHCPRCGCGWASIRIGSGVGGAA